MEKLSNLTHGYTAGDIASLLQQTSSYRPHMKIQSEEDLLHEINKKVQTFKPSLKRSLLITQPRPKLQKSDTIQG